MKTKRQNLYLRFRKHFCLILSSFRSFSLSSLEIKSSNNKENVLTFWKKNSNTTWACAESGAKKTSSCQQNFRCPKNFPFNDNFLLAKCVIFIKKNEPLRWKFTKCSIYWAKSKMRDWRGCEWESEREECGEGMARGDWGIMSMENKHRKHKLLPNEDENFFLSQI